MEGVTNIPVIRAGNIFKSDLKTNLEKICFAITLETVGVLRAATSAEIIAIIAAAAAGAVVMFGVTMDMGI